MTWSDTLAVTMRRFGFADLCNSQPTRWESALFKLPRLIQRTPSLNREMYLFYSPRHGSIG